ncbi:hypothetical protein Tco_0670774 [Tanacetum coccineum]
MVVVVRMRGVRGWKNGKVWKILRYEGLEGGGFEKKNEENEGFGGFWGSSGNSDNTCGVGFYNDLLDGYNMRRRSEILLELRILEGRLDQVCSFLIFLECDSCSKGLSVLKFELQTDNEDKKISSSNASLILEDYNPPLSDQELPFHIEIPGPELYSRFHPKMRKKFSTPGFSFLKDFIRCHRNYLIGTLKLSRIAPDYEAFRARGFVLRSLELHILSFIMGIEYPNLID